MNIDELLPLLRPYVSGCPLPIMREELRRAARRFFERSLVWREEVYLGFGAGMTNASIKLKAGQTLVSVIRAQLTDDTEPLSPAPAGMNWLSTERNKPQVYSSDKAGFLSLFPLQATNVTCKVKIAVKPEIGSAIIPDVEGDMYAEQIADGAAASILSMPDAEWYNPAQADYHTSKFERGISEARSKVEMGYSNTGGRVYGGNFI